MDEVLTRAKENHQRLVEAGGPTTRNIARRLAWKRAQGIDTTVEEQRCGLTPDQTDPKNWPQL